LGYSVPILGYSTLKMGYSAKREGKLQMEQNTINRRTNIPANVQVLAGTEHWQGIALYLPETGESYFNYTSLSGLP